MTSDDRLFAMVQRISAIESQLITRRSFLGATDPVGARSYRELQESAAGVGRGAGIWYSVSRVCRVLKLRPGLGPFVMRGYAADSPFGIGCAVTI